MYRLALATFLSISLVGAEPSAEQPRQRSQVKFQSCRDTQDYPCCIVSKSRFDEAMVNSLLHVGTRALVERELQEKGDPSHIRDEAIRRGREVYVVIDDAHLAVRSPIPVDVVATLEEVEQEAEKQQRDMFYLAVEKHEDKPWVRKPGIPAGLFAAHWGVFRYKSGSVVREVNGGDTHCVFRSRETTVVELQYRSKGGCEVEGSESTVTASKE